MKIIKPSVEIIDSFNGLDVIRKLELKGRRLLYYFRKKKVSETH